MPESTGLTVEQVRKLLDLVPRPVHWMRPPVRTGTPAWGTLADSTVEAPGEGSGPPGVGDHHADPSGPAAGAAGKLVSMRFGLRTGCAILWTRSGREFGVSRERARQIEGQAMEKLRQMGMKQGLEDFLE